MCTVIHLWEYKKKLIRVDSKLICAFGDLMFCYHFIYKCEEMFLTAQRSSRKDYLLSLDDYSFKVNGSIIPEIILLILSSFENNK